MKLTSSLVLLKYRLWRVSANPKEYTVQEGNVIFKDIDRQIDAEKNVLLETINTTKQTIGLNLNTLNKTIARLEADLNDLA